MVSEIGTRALSRRALFVSDHDDPSAAMSNDQDLQQDFHIVSLIVHTWTAEVKALKTTFANAFGVEFHGEAGPGKQIVTIEAPNEKHLMDIIGLFEASKGVISVSLVYHHYDEETKNG